MARIRTIKPEIWSSEQFSQLSFIARLLFIGMWNFADDHGVIPASHKSLQLKIFPGESAIVNDMPSFINELLDNNLIFEYEVSGKSYWWVITFTEHQKIDKPHYKYPLPSEQEIAKLKSKLNKSCKNSTTGRRLVVERSSTSRDQSPAEWKGMEGKGKILSLTEI